MHTHDEAARELAELVLRHAADRIALESPPLDHPRTPDQLRAAAGQTITPTGLGGAEAMRLFEEVLGPACLSVDHPRYFAFIPAAPTEAATLFDLIVSATSIYGGSWLEGAGAVYAENQTLAWLAGLAGMPATTGGTFVSGGSIANLSALAVARTVWRDADPARADRRATVLVSSAAHSSIASALEMLDLRAIDVEVDTDDRMSGAALQRRLAELDLDQRAQVCAVVATAGSTNTGVVDDLSAAADAAQALGVWLHVDGAYGGAALCSSTRRHLFTGVERADSLTVDPHKWLFAPYDCAAILYRRPELAKRTFTQRASYLDVLTDNEDWSPSDYGPHLTRRARGLPTWFSLAVHGTDAYRDAVDVTIATTEAAAEVIRASDHLELVTEPELSVVVFRRVGWTPTQYTEWCDRLLAEQVGFIVPTTHRGEMVLRICVVNPRTTLDDVRAVLPA